MLFNRFGAHRRWSYGVNKTVGRTRTIMKIMISKSFSAARGMAFVGLCGGLMILRSPAQDTIQPTAAPAALPSDIPPSSPVAQVIKLTQAGVDEGIIQTFITNSTSTFNLNSDRIIFLKDAGVPNELVKEMIQRDTVLHAQIAAAAPPPSLTPAAPATPDPAPDAPQPPPVDSQAADDAAPPPVITSADDFYAPLTPYGNWVTVEGYGRCWLPGVAVYDHDWQPYGDHGHWVYTDSGWYWASDYAWGWAPFHYGRWFHNLTYGWCWCPDNIWGPSWVTWRYDDDYCGWAPLPPGAYYNDGVGFVYDGSVVGDDFDFGLSVDVFVFVDTVDFCDPHPFRHHLPPNQAAQAYHQSKPFNDMKRDGRGFSNRGIDPDRIVRATHTPIRTVPLHTEAGVAGRFPPGGSSGHVYATPAARGQDLITAQNYRSGSEAGAAQNRPAQHENGPALERYAPPAPVQRAYAPPEGYRSYSPAPNQPQEPPRAAHPTVERPPEPPPARVEPPHAEPPRPEPAPTKPSEHSEPKKNPH